MVVTVEMTVKEAIQGSEARTRVLDRYGIDTCCGGKVPLRLACEKRGLDPDVVLRELEAADNPANGQPVAEDVSGLTLTALADHLIATHHQYLRNNLPRLVELSRKVARVHGPNHSELIQLAEVVIRFSNDMLGHLDKEEQVLFPFIRNMENAPGSLSVPAEFVAQPIRVMLMDHESADADLQAMRALTENYKIPPDACGSYRALFNGLAEMDADTVTHMAKENDILFARAVALSNTLA